MPNSTWNCPKCGGRVNVKGSTDSGVHSRCRECGQIQYFQRLDDLCLYEDRVLALQLAQPTAEPKNLARDAMLSFQCLHLVH
jgi:hypothetical protein